MPRDVAKQRKSQREYAARRRLLDGNVARQKRKDIICKLKEASPCMDCGVTYPAHIMQFDHRPGTEKHGSISRMLNNCSMAALLEEIQKCDLVCANCHADRTYIRTERSEYHRPLNSSVRGDDSVTPA